MIEFNFQEQFQLLKDVSLGAMSIFTWLLSVLATAMLLPKDIEDRTLYTILAKPVPRFEYLIGKLLGILLLLLISTLVMSALFVAALYGRQQMVIAETIRGSPACRRSAPGESRDIKASTFTWSLIPGIIIIYVKAALFASLTLFISTFASSSIFTIMVSVACYFIGHLQGIARDYWLGSATTGPLPRIFLASSPSSSPISSSSTSSMTSSPAIRSPSSSSPRPPPLAASTPASTFWSPTLYSPQKSSRIF
jgi:hypothetical protein